MNRTRQVVANQVISDQADFFQGDGYTRLTALTLGDIQLKVFWDNQVQPWTLVDGTNVTDALITSGSVYWAPIPGAAGYYAVRWRPSATGFWRIALNYSSGSQFTLLDYDIVPDPTSSAQTGLRASFSKH